MGAGFVHKCMRCGYQVSTSGPWEFYRDDEGNREPYGHPVPRSAEARQHGIAGLSGKLYCARCDRVFDVVLVEFEAPSQNAAAVWARYQRLQDEFRLEDSVSCPECRSATLILGPAKNAVLCPHCETGNLVGRMARIS